MKIVARKVLLIPMNPHREHAFGRLSGYIDAYWLYARKMEKEGKDPLVYLSHGACHGDPAECSDGYIYHDCGLRWHFDIVKDGTFLGMDLYEVSKTDWRIYVPPFRRYDPSYGHTYWFLLKNLRKLKSPIWGEKAKGGRILDKRFWKVENGKRKKIHSSGFRSRSGAPHVVSCAVRPPLKSDCEDELNPSRELMRRAITERGGVDEHTIEETFLLDILEHGFDGKEVSAIWQQEGFKDDEGERYRFDMAFELEKNGGCFAVEFKKDYGEDAPLQLAKYIKKSRFLKDKNPVPVIVCARKTERLEEQMKKTFPRTRARRIIEYVPKIKFETHSI